MSGILNIGMSGFLSFQNAIEITSQNIANVNTPYYCRRVVNFSEDLYGNGVNIADVTRVYDQINSSYLQQSNSDFSRSDIYNQQVSELESLLGDNSNDKFKNTIDAYINNALTAIRSLNGDSSSMAARTLYLDRLSTLSHRVNEISSQITQRLSNVNQSTSLVTNTINQVTQQIASLNGQISLSQSSDNSALLDAREVLVQQLAQYIDFTTTTDSSGKLDILMSNGTPLVFGVSASQLSTVPDPSYPSQNLIMLTTGTYSSDMTHFIQGGQLAGLINSQSVMQQAMNSIGQLAIGIMDSMNQQNKLGIDYNGNLGSNLFVDINNATVMQDRVINNLNNTGSAAMTVAISDVSQLVASDYTLKFNTATSYTLTRLSDNSVVSSGTIGALPQQVSADGFTININSGTIAAGDQFRLSPNCDMGSMMSVAISDPKLLALGWPVNAYADPANHSSGTVNVDSIVDTTNAAFSTPGQLNPPLIVKFLSPTSYQIVNATDSSVVEGPIAYDPTVKNSVFPTPGGYDPGYRVSLTGGMETGDAFNIAYNNNGVGDHRNGDVMESLYQQSIFSDGTLTYSQNYNLFSSGIADTVNKATIAYNGDKVTLKLASQQYSQLSGVVVQEETANLALYNQCLAANAQVLQTAKSIFDIIISLGR